MSYETWVIIRPAKEAPNIIPEKSNSNIFRSVEFATFVMVPDHSLCMFPFYPHQPELEENP